MSEKNDPYYLDSVHLSGYKSIKNVDVQFKPGLNIIIGKNAAGKTNFLSFLNQSLNTSFDGLFDFSSKISFKGSSDVEFESTNYLAEKKEDTFKILRAQEPKTTIKINGIECFTDDENTSKELHEEKFMLFPSFIKHGIPHNKELIDTPLLIKSNLINRSGVFRKIVDTNNSFFLRVFIAQLLLLGGFDVQQDEKEIRKRIMNSFNELDKIKKPIIKFSPIEDLRFSKDFNVFNDGETLTISNLFIEYKIKGSWHPFSNLSDGTQRLFCLISEVSYSGNLYLSKEGLGMVEYAYSRIILVEEPELGVHPHQLMQLMQFLKEESRTKQIIVTTHSPLVLDVLEQDELENIIIAYHEDNKEGTKLRHLDAAEIAKAKEYLKEDYLSDYWKYSDLEKSTSS